MILNIATIPHSGSRLLVDEILKTPWRTFKQKPVNGENFFNHIYTFNAPLHKQWFQSYPTIVAIRHPLLMATSWKKRNMDIGEMCVNWYILVEQLDKFNPYYLPVDRPDRNEYLIKINEGIGLDLKTDWPMTNSKHNTTKIGDLGEDQEQVDRLCKNIDHFLKRFYPRKPRGNKGTNSNKSPAKANRTGS